MFSRAIQRDKPEEKKEKTEQTKFPEKKIDHTLEKSHEHAKITEVEEKIDKQNTKTEKFQNSKQAKIKVKPGIKARDIMSMHTPSRRGETNAPVHRVSSFDVNLLSEEYSQLFNKTRPFLTFFSFLGGAIDRKSVV